MSETLPNSFHSLTAAKIGLVHSDDAGGAGDHPAGVPIAPGPFPSYSACKTTPWDRLSAPRNAIFLHFHVVHVDDAGGAGDHPAGVPIALGPLPSYSACKITYRDHF